MDQRDYWNSVSPGKEFTTPFQAEEFSRYVDTDARIVDIGCGYGRTLHQLREMGYRHLTGFDFSEGMILRGKHLFPELDLRLKTGPSIDLPDGSADAVILFAVLTCIPEDKEQDALVAEIRRILRPGGILYVNDFLLNSDERNQKRYARYLDRYGIYGVFELPEGAVLRHFSETRVRQLLGGFRQKEYRQLTFTTMNGNRSNGYFFIGMK